MTQGQLWLLRAAAAAVFLGRAWQHLRWDTSIWALLHNEELLSPWLPDLFGVSWQAYAQSPIVEQVIGASMRGVGVFYAVCTIVALLPVRAGIGQRSRVWWHVPHRIHVGVLLSGSLLLLGLAWLDFMDSRSQVGSLLEHGLQCAAPCFLLAATHGIRGARVRSGISRRALLGGMRVGIALTFAGHGMYAVGYYEVPGEFLTMMMNSLSCSEPEATRLLFVAGLLDFVVAGAALFGASGSKVFRIVIGYAIVWGALTASARLVSFVRLEFLLVTIEQWLHETVLRTPHALVPAVLWLAGADPERDGHSRKETRGRQNTQETAVCLQPHAAGSRDRSGVSGWARRRLGRFAAGAACFAFVALSVRDASAETGRYRLSYREDPATSIVVAWDQQSGADPVVHYGDVDHGTNADDYALSEPPAHETDAGGMKNQFAHLTDLEPNTAYYFVVADSEGVSERYWFKTAPATPEPFTLVVGGDTRNNRKPRRMGNVMVSKLRPLAVMLGGDFTSKDSDSQWQDWFDDWQSSISEDGRMYPLIAARGNHDSDSTVHDLWDTPHKRNYYRIGIAGGLAQLYTLNSERSAGGDQGKWLKKQLEKNRCSRFNLVQYHKPMRPHVSSKSEGNDEYENWASLFYDFGMDLAVECDSHSVKRTWPLRPDEEGDEGFVRDDARGTTYIGEGCWGAPLRSANDAKSWTRASGSFNQVNWVQVHMDRIEVRTVEIDDAEKSGSVDDADPLRAPAGLPLWEPEEGALVRVEPHERTDASGKACSDLGPKPGSGGSDPGAADAGTSGTDDDGGGASPGGPGESGGSSDAGNSTPSTAGGSPAAGTDAPKPGGGTPSEAELPDITGAGPGAVPENDGAMSSEASGCSTASGRSHAAAYGVSLLVLIGALFRRRRAVRPRQQATAV